MPRRRNTPGGPAAFAAYANGPGAAPPPPPRPSKAKAAAAYASRFVKSPDNWWLLLLLASAALYAQLLDAALAPKALEGFAVTGDANFFRDVVARHAKARVLVDGLGPLSSPVWRAHDDANDLLFAEASAQRVWRHEDGTGLVRVGASVFLDATGPLACVATAEADALVLCGDQSAVTVADDGTRETLWAGAASAISRPTDRSTAASCCAPPSFVTAPCTSRRAQASSPTACPTMNSANARPRRAPCSPPHAKRCASQANRDTGNDPRHR